MKFLFVLFAVLFAFSLASPVIITRVSSYVPKLGDGVKADGDDDGGYGFHRKIVPGETDAHDNGDAAKSEEEGGYKLGKSLAVKADGDDEGGYKFAKSGKGVLHDDEGGYKFGKSAGDGKSDNGDAVIATTDAIDGEDEGGYKFGKPDGDDEGGYKFAKSGNGVLHDDEGGYKFGKPDGDDEGGYKFAKSGKGVLHDDEGGYKFGKSAGDGKSDNGDAVIATTDADDEGGY